MCELSPNYTTFILGPPFLNFSTRAVNLGHGLRHLHDKNEFDLCQCLFREGILERKGTHKILSHRAFLQRFPRFRFLFAGFFELLRDWEKFGHVLALSHGLTWLKKDLLMVVIYNFRETRGTFEYILQEISEDIARQDTPMRKGVTLNRRLA